MSDVRKGWAYGGWKSLVSAGRTDLGVAPFWAPAKAPFDQAAARAWLEGPDPEVQDYTVAETLGVDADFDYHSDGWQYTIDSLMARAGDTRLLPPGTALWLTGDSEGVVDGALITREIGVGRSTVRLCSHFLDWHDLVDDITTKNVDAAVAVLSTVHAIASELRIDTAAEPTSVDPAVFADAASLRASVEVDVFRIPDQPLSLCEWAECGWDALQDLRAPVITLRNEAGEEVAVDLADAEEN